MMLCIKINRLVFILLIFIILLFPVNLFAHKLYVFAWVENGKIFTESKFSSNKWVKNGKISVEDKNGFVFLTGLTSDNGSFAFTIPENLKADLKSDIVILLDAGMGHKANWKLSFNEIFEITKDDNNKETAQKKKEEMIKKPGIINVSAGILVIFIFFGLMAYFKKKKLNQK